MFQTTNISSIFSYPLPWWDLRKSAIKRDHFRPLAQLIPAPLRQPITGRTRILISQTRPLQSTCAFTFTVQSRRGCSQVSPKQPGSHFVGCTPNSYAQLGKETWWTLRRFCILFSDKAQIRPCEGAVDPHQPFWWLIKLPLSGGMALGVALEMHESKARCPVDNGKPPIILSMVSWLSLTLRI